MLTSALIWQSVVLRDSKLGFRVDTVDDIRRNTNFTVASIAGTGVLKPEYCARHRYRRCHRNAVATGTEGFASEIMELVRSSPAPRRPILSSVGRGFLPHYTQKVGDRILRGLGETPGHVFLHFNEVDSWELILNSSNQRDAAPERGKPCSDLDGSLVRIRAGNDFGSEDY